MLTGWAKPSDSCQDRHKCTHIYTHTHTHMYAHTHTLPYVPVYRDSHIQTRHTTTAETRVSHQRLQSAKFKEAPLLGLSKGRISPESKCLLKFCTLDSWLSSSWSIVYDTYTYPVIHTVLHTWLTGTHTHTHAYKTHPFIHINTCVCTEHFPWFGSDKNGDQRNLCCQRPPRNLAVKL